MYFSFSKGRPCTIILMVNNTEHRWKNTLKGRRSTTCALIWTTVGVYFSATCNFLARHSFAYESCHDLSLFPINSNSSQTFRDYSRSEVIICVFLQALTPQTVPNSRDSFLVRWANSAFLRASLSVSLPPFHALAGRNNLFSPLAIPVLVFDSSWSFVQATLMFNHIPGHTQSWVCFLALQIILL